MNISTLRMRVADCDRDLRNQKDLFENVKALRVQAAQPSGKNKEERDNQIAVFLATDDAYQAWLKELRRSEYVRDCALAELEAAKDERRKAELESRDRRTAAYERLAIQRDKPDYATSYDDDAIDDAIDDAVHGISGELASQSRYAIGGKTFSRRDDLPF